MKKTLLAVAVALSGTVIATPFNGNDAQSNAMGNTGVASSEVQNAVNFNPALLADQYDGVGFGMTLPSIKFYIDDSKGMIQNGEEFISGGVWEDFQNIDAAAFEAAVSSTPTRITNVTGNVTTITNTVNAIQADLDDDGQLDDPSLLTTLDTASNNLTTNSALLDTDVTTLNTQSNNLDTAISGALSGLVGFNNRPLQLGLGIDVLNAAIPSETLGMAVSVSTNTTVGVQVNISATDSEPVENLSDDLTGITAKASILTTEINQLAVANQALTAHFGTQPDINDYGVTPRPIPTQHTYQRCKLGRMNWKH